jgi:hypothetical protein
MAFVKDDDVVQAFPSDRADHALDVGVFCNGERGAVTTSVIPMARPAC